MPKGPRGEKRKADVMTSGEPKVLEGSVRWLAGHPPEPRRKVGKKAAKIGKKAP
jgi:hypothetical protein